MALSGKQTKIGLTLLLAVPAVLTGTFWICPSLYVRAMQVTGMVRGTVNGFESKNKPMVLHLPDGIDLQTEIRYGTQYPNSWLDVYRNAGTPNLPTFIYIHGGGYAWGDKAEGDPTAASDNVSDATAWIRAVCTGGFNAVSINYALSPEFVYPTPILQIDQAVQFLQREQNALGLNLSKVIFCGGSAGGQLAGQYVNIQTNPDYAANMGIKPALTKEEILGVVFNCALLEPKEFSNTGERFMDLMFSVLERCYFGTDDKILRQADVIENLSDDFPATFLTDGNHGTFDAQAVRMDQALTKRGIRHTFNFYPASQASLAHGYDSCLKDSFAQDNLKKVQEFLHTLTS